MEKEQKKKKWLQIYASENFNKFFLGESLVSDAEELIGKSLNINLMTLTNDMKRQQINILFKVDKISENSGIAEPLVYKMSPSYIKKLVRRKRDKLDLSFKAKTKDNVPVVIKLLLITLCETPNSVQALLRKTTIKTVTSFLENSTFYEAFNKIVSHNMQTIIRDATKKIYPLRIYDVRYFSRDDQ